MNFYTLYIFLCFVLFVQPTLSEWSVFKPNVPPMKYTQKMRDSTVFYTMKQRVNHFSPLNQQTFNMRYVVNNEFYSGYGPMFLFISGENYMENSLGYIYKGLMHEIASQTGASMYMMEHRYYGESVPNGNLNTWNMRNLRVKQALADIAEFVKAAKSADTGLRKVILFGGSYAAMLATWARKIYPDIIDGAVAASGAYKRKMDYYQYLEVFANDIAPYPNCSSTIQNGVQVLNKKLSTFGQYAQVANDLGISIGQTLLASFLPYYKQLVVKNLILPMTTQAQNDKMVDYSVARMCDDLTYNSNQLDDYTRLTSYYRELTKNSSGGNSTKSSRTTTAWMYQVCTELGLFVTTTSTNQPFYNFVPLSYWRKTCTRTYSKFSTLTRNYRSTQLSKTYGDENINVTRVVFIGGTLDPWQPLNVQKSPNSEAPVIIIPDVSHCSILIAAAEVNTPEDQAARVKITQLVKQWIQ